MSSRERQGPQVKKTGPILTERLIVTFTKKALTLLISAALVLADISGFGLQAQPSIASQVQTADASAQDRQQFMVENEDAAIQACLLLALAQERYKATLHSDDPESHYATHFVSSPGKQDGLYSGPESSIPAFLANAGVNDDAQDNPPAPYAGYYFRILTQQGKSARGGAQNYLVNGRLTAGFAFVAYPAEYRASGVMTFIVDQDNIVYQKDLGPETVNMAQAITRYNPGEGWRQAE